jgi:uncharacterized protein YbcI
VTEPGTVELAEKGSVAAGISRGMVQLMSHYTGRGATRARTTVNTNVIVVILEDALTKGEQNLVAGGQADAVLMMRQRFQTMMRGEAVELVENLSNRTVVSCLSDVDPEQNFAVQVFVLEHRPETGVGGAAEAELEATSIDPPHLSE